MNKKQLCMAVLISAAITGGMADAAQAATINHDGKVVDKADNDISVELRYFNPDMNASVRSGSIHYNGDSTPVDFKNDLNVSADKAPELKIGIGKNLEFDYLKVSGSGRGAIMSKNLHFSNMDVQVNDRVDTDIDMSYTKLAYKKDWRKTENVRTYWMADVKYVKFD